MTNERRFFDPDYLCHEQLKAIKGRKRSYLNVSSSFDIEDTSFYDEIHGVMAKCAVMYCFVFGLNGKVIFGRTWSDFIAILEALQKAYDLSEERVLPVYVHNLSHEFAFLCKRLEWIDVFANSPRNPLRALCKYGIEFRDSYILSGQSLDGTSKNLTKYKILKLKGDLDYSRRRHSKTILTPEEWHYVENDGLSLMCFIQEEIERNGNNITRIPMTKTGYTRKHLRAECYHGGQKGHGERRKDKTNDYARYRKLMDTLTMEKGEYLLAKRTFAGGFTHANIFNVGLTFEDVTSMDLRSAYPASMVLDLYPMGKGRLLEDYSPESIKEALRHYFCVFDIKIYGLKSKFKGDNFLSKYHCREIEGESLDNGRVIRADYVLTSLTGLDLDTFRAFYTMERIEISNLWYYPKAYLPRNFIKGILELYANKTALKDVEGEEANYLISKELLNSAFGCCVTAIEQPLNVYKNGEWSVEEKDIDATLKEYNESKNRFLFYLWGIAITAHVRHTIAMGVLELGDDYIYSDTDSLKFRNYEKHRKWFDDYNAKIMRKIARSSRINNIKVELFQPKTKKGVEKPIGVFDFEGTYKRFKTLGAKRYFVENQEPKAWKTKDGGEISTPYSLTIAGVNKRVAIPYLASKAKEEGKDIFEYFEIGYVFDEEACGKLLHTYCDYPIQGYMVDYRGVRGFYSELSFVHLEPTTYEMTSTEEYIEAIYMDELERLERREIIRL